MARPLTLLAVALLAAGSGCMSHERYGVRDDQLAQLEALPPDVRATYAIPAVRIQDDKNVFILGARIPTPPSNPFEIRAPNRKVKIGAVLTLVGTAISLVGSGLFFFSSGKSKLVGEVLAPAAEPLMISGTVLWVIGALEPPGEVDPGKKGLTYLPR